MVVRVDGNSDGVGAVADDRPGERQLEPAQAGIAEDAAERPDRVGELVLQAGHLPTWQTSSDDGLVPVPGAFRRAFEWELVRAVDDEEPLRFGRAECGERLVLGEMAA